MDFALPIGASASQIFKLDQKFTVYFFMLQKLSKNLWPNLKVKASHLMPWLLLQFEAINDYRKLHGVTPLTLDKKVTKDAQTWADHLAATGKFEHSKNSNYGENIAAGYPLSNLNPATLWYSEISRVNFSNIERSSSCFHFTQIIWKSSKKIGIGISKSSKTQMYYVVANFDPAGNMMGSFAENVPPPLKKK
uniref:SCP domain-containing protein n=1 Tax=Panagrolaimus sp. ES5 TaxID=591445 RepID=A0AC34FRT7_9BILA